MTEKCIVCGSTEVIEGLKCWCYNDCDGIGERCADNCHGGYCEEHGCLPEDKDAILKT